MKKTRLSLFLIVLVAIGLIGYVSVGYAAHPDVTLKDGSGTSVAGTTNPYSPKQTCAGCHFYDLSGNKAFVTTQTSDFSDYEKTVAYATKDHGAGSPSYSSPYSVPYPLHGVSAGYHFQQGRNMNWGDTQRTFYGQASFTSSGGMYGKY